MWSNWNWTDSIKKRVGRYLLQRYLGQYLLEKISLDQLSVDVYHGTGNVTDVTLDTTALNQVAEQQNLPIEFIDGHFGNVSVSIPWSSIMQDSCEIEVTGMHLTIQPKGRHDNGSSMLDSMWTSMASSMQLAEECLKTTDIDEDAEVDQENSTPLAGLEHCAQTIDAILGRVKVCFQDTVVRIVLGGEYRDLSLACEFHINMCKYSGTSGDEDPVVLDSQYCEKKVQMEGVRCFIDIGGMQNSVNDMDLASSSPTLAQIGRFDGRQTLKVKLRKDNSIRGPQVSVECNLGSFYGYVSPFQVHILVKLVEELLHPYNNDSVSTRKLSEKPMDTFDFKRVEDELQEHLKPSGIGLSGLQRQYGWSFPTQDENDEQFLPFETSKTNLMHNDVSVVMESSMMSTGSSMDSASESMFCSSTTSIVTEASRRNCVEKIKFTVSCLSLNVVVLEQDIVKFFPPASMIADPMSVESLKTRSCSFFSKLGLGVSLSDRRDVNEMCKRLHSCCSSNHVILIATPAKLEGYQSVEGQVTVTSGHVSFGYFQMTEFLRKNLPHGSGGTEAQQEEQIQLLEFTELDKGVEAVRLDFTDKTASSHSSRSNLRIRLQPCSIEFDMSIVDRLQNLLFPSLSLFGSNVLDADTCGPAPSKALGLLLKVPKAFVNFRFPVPSFVSLEDIDLTERNIRADSVALKMHDLLLSTLLDSRLKNSVVEAKCREAELYYKETQSSELMLIATASSYSEQTDTLSMRSQGYDWPRVLVSVCTDSNPQQLIQDSRYEAAEDESLGGFFTGSKHPSPFSRQRILHEGHLGDEHKKEHTMPGDTAEINKFIESTCAASKFNIQVDLRCVKINLPSKNVFEQLYNRVSVDLLLWEPVFWRQQTSSGIKFDGLKSHIFKSCRYAADFAEEPDEEEQPSSLFVPEIKKRQTWKNRVDETGSSALSEVCFTISINEGTCSINNDDPSTGAVMDGGRLTIVGKNVTFFIVSGYNGRTESGYMCAMLKGAELLQSDPNYPADVFMRRIIHPCEETVQAAFQTSTNPTEMLSLAIKIDRDLSTNIKTFKVATAIKRGTLNHVVGMPGTSWLGQLIDFFDVIDIPVAGYTPASVIVEFHLHLLDCAVDYKPLYLPLRSIVALERLTISSNIAAQAKQSVLQIMVEDSALFISNKPESVNLMDDYVCVMELDILEILLRTCQVPAHAPAVDLSLTNNKLQIRTCSDSYTALIELFTYFANDGDLRNFSKDSVESASICSGQPSVVQEQKPFGDYDPEHSTEKLVAEAMFDDTSSTTSTTKENGCIISPPPPPSSRYMEPVLGLEPSIYGDDPIMETSSDQPIDIHPSDDEEFCILENDPGVGIISKTGEPKARVLVDGGISLVENHFSLPAGRSDILRAPKHYPKAVMRYTVQDITIVWDIYAGQDFNDSLESKPSEVEEDASGDPFGACDIGTDALEYGVLFSKPKAFESAWLAYQQAPSPRTKGNSWRENGGRGRRKDICVEFLLAKAKFQHEVYPQDDICSRQVLVINTVEIKDKLVSSQFNKMLYLHTSSSKPKQSHANMVVIKLVQSRTNPQLNLDECTLKVSLLPIRLNIDQDTLLFLYKFYADPALQKNSPTERQQVPINQTVPQSSDRSLQTLKAPSEAGESVPAPVPDPIREMDPDTYSNKESSDGDSDNYPPPSGNTPAPRGLYFKKVVITNDVPIQLDYHGKRVDLTHGPLAGILMGLAQLNNSEIRLKRINHLHGILGVDRLIKFLVSEWSQDIAKNQLPSLLGGVGPMHSFVQLFQGVRDLFWMPIEQYNKDGRIAKGIQRGANSFSTSTAMAVLEITNRMVRLIQGAAEITYDMVSPSPGLYRNSHQVKGRKRRHTQPADIRQGVTNAYHVVKDGLGDTAKSIVHVASKEHEQKGMSGAVGGVLRHIPPTVVHPIILVAEATSNVLDGFRSHLEPEFKKQEEEKWKESS